MAGNTVRAAREAACRMLAELPDIEGVVLTDNLFAPTVQGELKDRRVRILGFGDEIFAMLCEPKLSYMRLPVEAMAQASTTHLVQWINRPEEHVPLRQWFRCEPVIQET